MKAWLALLPLLAWPARAQPSADSLLEDALPGLRASRADLGVRPERWDTRLKLDSVEALLNDPLKIPSQTVVWTKRAQESAGSADLLRLAGDILGLGKARSLSSASMRLPDDPGLSPDLRSTLDGLVAAIAQAGPYLDRAVGSLSPEERTRVLEELRPFLRNEQGGRTDPGAFDAAARFDEPSLLEAAALVTRAVDAALPILQKADARQGERRRWHLPIGDVLLSGAGEDVYSAQDLEGVALLVDLGGDDRYAAAPAAAGAGKIRVVIDLGADVRVDAAGSGGGPASGTFGIGLLYLPNPAGEKKIAAGDVSLGAGLFGVGGLFVAGSTVTLESGRFSQGAAAFGAGVLDSRSPAAMYTSGFAGQGFGFTRGAGLFRHRGDGARLVCGLSDPDPHEDLAFTSLCQGTGDGPRAFAAGGVGLAAAMGNRLDLKSGYFAQGSGYWHGLGLLAVIGDGSRLQARRYDQGSGIHTAIGVLTLKGDGSRTVNWGVGPAYGWDWGVGYFESAGDDGAFSADWAAGHGDTDGRALALIRGDRNRLALPDFGSGAWFRDAASYGLALVSGKDDRYRWNGGTVSAGGFLSVPIDPWGRLQGDFALDPDMIMPKPVWPSAERGAAAAKERESLGKRYAAAEGKPAAERMAQWLSIAASSALDGTIPFKAAQRLLSLPAAEVPVLVGLVSSDQFDEFVWQRALVPSYGKAAAAEIASELPAARGTRKALLLRFLRGMDASAARTLQASLDDPDWRVRKEAAGGLGVLLDRERGAEPGRHEFLWQAEELCERGEPLAPGAAVEKEAFDRLGVKRLSDFYGLLALSEGFSGAERLSMLEQSPGPVEPMNPQALRELVRLLLARREEYRRALKDALAADEAAGPAARRALLKALHDPEPEVAQAALTSLAQWGDARDAGRIAGFLDHPAAALREAAAAGLGKMGVAGQAALLQALGSATARTRALAALGLAQTSDPGVLHGLARAFEDRDAEVRLVAVSGLAAVQAPLREARREFAARLARLVSEDPSASVRAAAARALKGIAP